MGILRRILLVVFIIATLLGVGFLSLSWFEIEFTKPAVDWLSAQAWFPIVLLILLGVLAVGLLVLLVWIIAAPRLSHRLSLDKGAGLITISREALIASVRTTVQKHSGLTAKRIRVKITGRKHSKLRIFVKVDPGPRSQLAQLGHNLKAEIITNIEHFTGHEVKRLRISFTQPEAGARPASSSGAGAQVDSRTDRAEPLSQPAASH